MDIEGYEWDVFSAMLEAAAAARAQGRSDEDILPEQMSVEVHYLTSSPELSFYGRDRSPGEILSLFNHMFYAGGYVVIDRNDNRMCDSCTEVVLGKVGCW